MYTGEKIFRCDSSSSSFYFLNDDELEYEKLIQEQIQPYFPKFAAAISQQSPAEREWGRCAAVDFASEASPHVTTFENSADVQSYFTEALSTQASESPNSQPRRRLFILEDLPCNHILALGSRLRIPPSFFAGHWDDPASSTFNHRNPFQRSTKSKPQFRLRYATSNRFEVLGSAHTTGNVYGFNTNVCRYLHVYNPSGLLYDEPRSHHTMSFWSSPVREDGSWDAVLLVDPPLGTHVRCLPSRQLVPIRRQLANENSMPSHFLNPEFEAPEELPQDSSQWADSYVLPEYKCIFDDTLHLLVSRNGPKATAIQTPMDAVEMPRKLVISTLTAFLRRRYLNLLNIQKITSSTLRHNYMCSFSEGSLSSWHEEFFDFVVGACAAMKVFSEEIEDNVVALGLHAPDAVAAELAPRWEVDGWTSIRDLTRIVEGMTQSFSTGYLQYISIQEARVSNSNAQSLSRITVLTMLFIPLSTVASIFSVGDDFLPGQPRAWVFWIVAIPVLMALVSLYWYRHLVSMLKKRKQGSSLLLFELGKKT
ncbi:hypothetical protein K505DRAFT_256295 [Melanomma pulvis-pyrius CBS 109.77]|uniref:Cora-domain-containing protein n=1 Tax=Melanomma pulvis-pyrius CBS 109.77 TaxID=1314802 RepID=A0A6A6WVZ4_9PLEO|nr:hypothetical protein K505DRAFT_256295 [Melanomma pulvis-pyrius CBS 109.77]